MIGWYYLFFFLSGLTALVFETAFARQLNLIFGGTLPAVSVVLAVYLGGMALGAVFLGSRADHVSPLRLYGLLEIGVGVFALLAVILIPLIRNIYAAINPSGSRILIQSVLAVVILLPSTLLMGATLPAVSRGLTTLMKQRFSRLGGLYGVNTIGAASGTLLCGFFLLEHLGYMKTVIAAMFLNFAIGFFAIYLATRIKRPEKAPQLSRKPATELLRSPASRLQILLLVLAGFSGLAALGYEVVWFRILTFSIVADAHAFALMLGIYLLGIGGGSLIALIRFRIAERKTEEPAHLWAEFGVLEVGISVLAVVGFSTLIWMNVDMPRPDISDPSFWWKTLRNTIWQALVLILPTTLLLGYLFPLLVSLYTTNIKRFGGQVGKVLAANTAGSILGILGSGFILIPLVGIQVSLLILAIFSALVGLTALILGPISKGLRIATLSFCLVACILVFFQYPIQPHFGFLQIPNHENARLLYYHESSDQTVMVTEDRRGHNVRRLLLNQQQATATGLAGQRKNQLLGHLPLWANPEAKNALVICFGSGGTFGALGLYDLDRVDCVEICPSVIQAASYFTEWNGNVLEKPHVRVIIDDGRSYLLTTDELYDVITLEPMHPGLKGVTALYSREFYHEARKKLNPGGVICQWVPLYSMSGQDAKSLIRTALQVFPQSSFWLIGTEGILLCARDSLQIDWTWMNRMVDDEDIHRALHKVRLDDPWAVLSGYLLGPEKLKGFVGDAPIIRDDKPFTEYSIPRHQHVDPWEDILQLVEIRESPLELMYGMSDSAMILFSIEWEQNRKTWVNRDRGFAAYQQGDLPAARKYLEATYNSNPNDRYANYFLKELYWRYGIEFTKRGYMNEAVEAYQKACMLEPDDAHAHFYLANSLLNAGLRSDAAKEVQKALDLDPTISEAQRLLKRLRPNQ
ncbi:hypothetical protein CEE37_00045 [candidate division LCP-89 bacterium B3_LCP]|uniref:PABS domain-containing protein n=1 Tax=candidate division LCP-89 bacterium B3_LCP TaxID=2012998 RepID=A0A532V4G8_UNCL8|nr:MAG: hypothetical protein CEE37_00045 [candidate division LCP-89 bacterium B3_LCP]